MSKIEAGFLLRRRIAKDLLGAVFPIVIEEKGNGLNRLPSLCCQGMGILLILNHETKRDVPDCASFIFGNPVLGRKELVSAMAYHQVQEPVQSWLVRHLAPLLGIKVYPVVTPHTVSLGLNDNLSQGSGLEEFLKGAVETLGRGGVVGLAIQAQRRRFQDDIEAVRHNPRKAPPALGFFFAKTAGFDNFAVLPLGIKNEGEFEGEFIPFRRSTVVVGDIYTKDEVLQIVGQNPAVPENLTRSISVWGFQEIGKLLS